jgi:hypothetical protein
MMQMLAAGGMAILTDGERKADADNPKGYGEWERVKQLPQHPEYISEAEDKVVKVISQLLLSLPAGHEYRVIFMERPLPEVLASQSEMIRRRGQGDTNAGDSALTAAFQAHLKQVRTWLKDNPNFQVLYLSYHQVLQDPVAACTTIQDLIGRELNIEAMAQQVDPSLYRQRTASQN